MSSQPSNPAVTYDFSPFLTTPTITSSLSPRSPVSAIPIPETLIASPLAPNLAPHILLSIHEFLTGDTPFPSSRPPISASKVLANNGRWTGLGSSLGKEKGEEVWRSWKRAFDLWNGYYVEGRVNEGWVGDEYEGVKKELEEARKRKVTSPYRTTGKTPPGASHTPSQNGNWSTRAENGKDDAGAVGGMSLGDDVYGSFTHPISRGVPPELSLRPAGEVEREDGSTGGFMPMKVLPEYLAPDTDACGIYPEGWEDVLANTVWRPRRVGEKEVEVGMDGEWGGKSEFEFDGGVDCGRSPYPCLRYVVEYVRRDGCFLKKKVWDRVTGTIFNMPTKPALPPCIIDEQRLKMSTLYGNFYRDKAPRNRNPDYFPLDIRRVDKIDPTTGKRHVGTPLLEDGEELERWPWNNPEGTLTELDKSDPWYVADEQQELALVPPRKYPPGKLPSAEGDTLLPTDDTIWKEEVDNDDTFYSQYFVTNLHGGTLVVNGQEVKLGQIAGPLPEFAIIETPGNQISFWFGPGGRNWRGGPDDTPTYRSQWKTLRRSPGWENVGLTAGQVWDLKIRDRLRREYIGAEYADDAQWAEWKTPVVKGIPQTLEQKPPLEVVIWNGRPGTSPADNKQTPEDAQPEFLTELEELEWLVTIADPLKDVTSTLERENIIEPPGSAFWPGPYASERPDIIHQRTAQKFWKIRRDAILQQQREMNAVLAEKRAVRAHEKKQKVDTENKKRKAASSDGPTAKRARREAAAEARAKVQAEYEKNRAARQEELDRQKEELEISKWREAKLEANAAIAAKIREALQAQARKLSSLPKKEREREEKEIEAQIRSEHEEQQRQEKMIKGMRVKELNMERAQKGLQLLPEVTTLSDAEVRRLADERQKRAQKQEEDQRKKSAIENRSQEAGTQRKEAEQKQKKTAPAVKQVAEPAKDDLAALAKKVADAKAADAEKRRLQFIADKKLANEQRKQAVAATEARAEAMKRERLFKEKYGVLPGERLRLDASGSAKPSQGFEPPKKKTFAQIPNFRFLSQGENLDNLTDEYWQGVLEYAKQLSLQPPTPPGGSRTGEESVDFSKLTLQQQLELAAKSWMMKEFGNKNLEDQVVSEAIIESMKDSARERGARKRLELKAQIEGVSTETYAQNRGFSSADAYIWADIRPDVPEDYPRTQGPPDLPTNVLAVSRYWIQREAREGLEIRAKLEKRSTDDIVKEKGHANTEQYLQTLSNSITEDDIPPMVRNQDVRELKWEALNRRITSVGEWEYRIRALPGAGRAESHFDWANESYAEI